MWLMFEHPHPQPPRPSGNHFHKKCEVLSAGMWTDLLIKKFFIQTGFSRISSFASFMLGAALHRLCWEHQAHAGCCKFSGAAVKHSASSCDVFFFLAVGSFMVLLPALLFMFISCKWMCKNIFNEQRSFSAFTRNTGQKCSLLVYIVSVCIKLTLYTMKTGMKQ